MERGSDRAYRELFKRIGDPAQTGAALADLFNLCRKDFMKYIRAAVRDDEAVKDIFEDLMVEVCLAPQRVVVKDDPKSWMTAMVRNLIRRYFRTVKNMPTYVDLDEYIGLVGYMSAEERQLYLELEGLITDIAAGLTPKRREVFLLHWHEGLPLDGIARRLGRSRHTVKKQLAKAIKEVGKAVEQQWGVKLLGKEDKKDNDHDSQN